MSDATERYEELASAFYEETGVMAPGKDMSAALGGYDADILRVKLWRVWLKSRTPTPPPVTLLEEWRVVKNDDATAWPRFLCLEEAHGFVRLSDHTHPHNAPHRVVRLAYVAALAPDDAGVRDAS